MAKIQFEGLEKAAGKVSGKKVVTVEEAANFSYLLEQISKGRINHVAQLLAPSSL